MHMYQLTNSSMGRRLWSGEGAASVACHAQCNGLFAYTGNGQLCTRTADSPVKMQQMEVRVLKTLWQGYPSDRAMPAIRIDVRRAAEELTDRDVASVMQGYVVGFSGSRLYCLQEAAIQATEAPLSAALHCYLQKHDVDAAYQVTPRSGCFLRCPAGFCPGGLLSM